jgi:hypothetical protein
MNTTTASNEKKPESCQSCGFTIKDGRLLRCGFDYFQIAASERRTPKLNSFSVVASNHVCHRWSGTGTSVLKANTQPVHAKTAETIYYLPGHGGLISTGLGQALLERGYDVTGRETVGEFKSLGFQAQVQTIASDLRDYFWRVDACVIANSFGAYLFLHAQALLGEPYFGKVVLLSPIVGEFANDDQTRPMNFIPPYAEKLLELASTGKFPVPLNCEIHTGSEDWQSYANSKVFGELVGIKVTVVEGAGHMLPKPYVAMLLDNLAKPME